MCACVSPIVSIFISFCKNVRKGSYHRTLCIRFSPREVGVWLRRASVWYVQWVSPSVQGSECGQGWGSLGKSLSMWETLSPKTNAEMTVARLYQFPFRKHVFTLKTLHSPPAPFPSTATAHSSRFRLRVSGKQLPLSCPLLAPHMLFECVNKGTGG